MITVLSAFLLHPLNYITAILIDFIYPGIVQDLFQLNAIQGKKILGARQSYAIS